MRFRGPSRRDPQPFRHLALLPLLLAISPAGGASAAPEGAGSALTVPQASICTEVKDREAVGAASQFPTTVGRLYCLTKIAGAAEPTHVTHLWYHEDKQVHKVELSVGGPAWRTWSYKTIPPGWTGSWRVDVTDASGVVIYSIPFTISDQAGEAKGEPSSTPAPKEEPN